ncbi:uncharacterized protein THITE_2114864 [Thermothielavioides terrestris NRRL 8126]|uniref:Uncharacterized protein n=1 Tax=Thermothielavioides terrestris (strain ATCC 38088 / NRRL 8126) TaxID=578455 RepID=G2R255_THETT|nr:uncharacterized protein THITE_2114864 [Thermothielavioides terrestris NRRL 8126]AEO66639.1 hypothetical protein THITE_2114864 [Thermothielavioides terrestris NRRL 8126]
MGEGDKSPHLRGQREILRIRLPRGVDSEKWVDRLALASVQMQNISPQASPTLDIPLPQATSSPYADPAATLQEILLPRVTSITGAIAALPRIPPIGFDAMSNASELLCVHQELREWEASLPNQWKYQVLPKLAFTEQDPFPPSTSSCRASPWLEYGLRTGSPGCRYCVG